MPVFHYAVGHGLVTVLSPIVASQVERGAEHRKFGERYLVEPDLGLCRPSQYAAAAEKRNELPVFQFDYLIIICSAECLAIYFARSADKEASGRRGHIIPGIVLQYCSSAPRPTFRYEGLNLFT